MGVFDFLFNYKGNSTNVVNTDAFSKGRNFDKAFNFKEEFGQELSDNTNTDPENPYLKNGVKFEEDANSVKVVYDGILVKNGADSIYAAVGYGNNNNWGQTNYFPMKKNSFKAYEVLVPIERNGNMNIAFKDTSSNWDNNSGMNYIFKS